MLREFVKRQSYLTAMIMVAMLSGTGCGRGPSSTNAGAVSQAKQKLQIGDSSQDKKPVLGSGWDSSAETFKSQCVTGEPKQVGEREARALSDSASSLEKVQSDLGFDASAKGHYGIASFSFAADMAQSMTEDDYSQVWVYESAVNMGSLMIDGTINNTPLGDQAAANWADVCGDQVVSQLDNRARFYVVQRLDFSTREEKSRFSASVGASFDSGASSADTQAKLKESSASFKKTARVHVEIYQFGGNEAAAQTVFAGIDGVQEVNAKKFVECSIDNLTSCDQVKINAVLYTAQGTKGGFMEQLMDPKYAVNPMSYQVWPWAQFNRNNNPKIVTQEIKNERVDLQRRFDDIMKIKVRTDRVLNPAFSVPATQQDKIKNFKNAIQDALRLVNAAVTECYDNLKFDSTGKLTSGLDTCNSAVDAAKGYSLVIPDGLLSAGGTFAIENKWNDLGGAKGVLGEFAVQGDCTPTGDNLCHVPAQLTGASTEGLQQSFQGGYVFWSPTTDAFAVPVPILGKYLSEGGPTPGNGFYLGFPIADAVPVGGNGSFSDFQYGAIYYSPATGTQQIHGVLRGTWEKKWGGVNGHLGFPVSDVGKTESGLYCNFEHGTMTWFPNDAAPSSEDSDKSEANAHVTWGSIHDDWAAIGVEHGPLGFPVTEETSTPDKLWRFNEFQNGAIYFSVKGGYTVRLFTNIWEKWKGPDTNSDGNPVKDVDGKTTPVSSTIGYPTENEKPTAARGDGVQGTSQRFEKGSIYWTAPFGAHHVDGGILSFWAQNGAEGGRFGYPTSDTVLVTNSTTSWFSNFEHGSIYWDERFGPVDLSGTIRAFYSSREADLGIPTQSATRWWSTGGAGPFGSPGHWFWKQCFTNGAITATDDNGTPGPAYFQNRNDSQHDDHNCP